MPSSRPASPGCGVRIQSAEWRAALRQQIQRVGIDHRGFATSQRSFEQRPRPLVPPEAGTDGEHVGALDQWLQFLALLDATTHEFGRSATIAATFSARVATVTSPAPTRKAASPAMRAAPAMPIRRR